MTLLGGDAAALFGELLGDEYLAATLHKGTLTYDDEGDVTRASAPTDCRVQVERATERMIAADGYAETDRAIYVLAQPGGGLDPITALDSDHEITVTEGPYAGQTYKVSSPIDRDPAGAYWLCRGVESKGADNG